MARGIIHIDFSPPKEKRKPYGHFDMFPSTGQGIKKDKGLPYWNIHDIQNITDIDRISEAWKV